MLLNTYLQTWLKQNGFIDQDVKVFIQGTCRGYWFWNSKTDIHEKISLKTIRETFGDIREAKEYVSLVPNVVISTLAEVYSAN